MTLSPVAGTVASPPPTATVGRPRVMKKCTVAGCESFARSRGCCKAHGGGKRCGAAGCELSDQGGGHCIRHGGGRRCEVPGCNKSAQSRGCCKAHGGGVRCRVEGCNKTSQGGGCCRSHGGGPRGVSKKKTQQPRSNRPVTLAPRGVGALSCGARARLTRVRTANGVAAAKVEQQPESPPPTSCMDTQSQQSSLAMKTLAVAPFGGTKSSAFAWSLRSRESSSDAGLGCGCRRDDGCEHVAPLSSSQPEQDTNILLAASLLGMLSAGSS